MNFGIPKNDPYNQEQPIRPTIVKGRAYFQDTESSLWVVFRFTKKGPTDIVSLSKSFFIFSAYHWSKSSKHFLCVLSDVFLISAIEWRLKGSLLTNLNNTKVSMTNLNNTCKVVSSLYVKTAKIGLTFSVTWKRGWIILLSS